MRQFNLNMCRDLLAGLIMVVIVSSCATVRKKDLDSWKGVDVEALDTHSLWVTIPMKSVKLKNGTEVRYYINSANINQCSQNSNIQVNTFTKSANLNSFENCVSSSITCNNIFKIKNGKVLSYEPKGKCYTDETVQPEGEYRKR